ncbi:MAG TPA: pyruvate, phosphate dikinase, partial [Leptospiraceae bacterium]|nr:pyruvate, phosphate dikinase [Leptospiraceae bacterium]
MSQYVYFFGEGRTDAPALDKMLLGGKGANLCEMSQLGIPVPPGIVITTDACKRYVRDNRFPTGLLEEVLVRVQQLNSATGKVFGNPDRPLLVSVRSGAPVSMPGMMDTILNLGLNSETLEGMVRSTGNERFVCDSYRRFVQMYGDVVLGMEHHDFEHILNDVKKSVGAASDTDLRAGDLREIIRQYKDLVRRITGNDFPEDVHEQLRGAIEAVFKSWNNDRANIYRRLNHISDDLGTAVTVQSMVFGNMGDTSGTGVAFTRNPSTGERKFYGEYLMNAQGEDVVAGIRTPYPIGRLGDDMPEVFGQLDEVQKKLEAHYHDMQDLEFTIQEKKLYMLQTRSGKRTGVAALRMAVEMVDEGLIDRKTALKRVDPESIPSMLAPVFDPEEKKKAIKEKRYLTRGLNAGPGAASGIVVFDSWNAQNRKIKGEKTILVRMETSPEDIAGMEAAEGILTARGGMTSHAAVVARGMNKPCIVGCSSLHVEERSGFMAVATEDGRSIIVREGESISIDGSTGEVMLGHLPTRPSEIQQVLDGLVPEETSMVAKYFKKFMSWTDEVRTLQIRTNADTPRDARIARTFGAQGIGLCRTEHMFFEGDRIAAMQEMILSDTVSAREKALEKLLPYQREDFIGIFEAMEGLPVTIRLLDPPLHEFIPHDEGHMGELAHKSGVSLEKIRVRVEALKEQNPMLGHRGCRLGVTYPEITKMQVRAILEAAVTVKKKGKSVYPEIMIPLVGHIKELRNQKELIEATAQLVMRESNTRVDYLIGTMIEVPRAAIVADEIAQEAKFFSFGTNDLTQMAM